MQTIGGFQRSTLVDYPGKVACSIFFNDCNFRCGYCHNPHLIFDSREIIFKEEVLNFLDKRKGLLDAVVLSGGEPCISEDIIEFVRKIKEKGFLVKLDTNGYFPDILERCLPYLDYIAMDIKGNLDNYEKVVNRKVDIENIKKSIELVKCCKDYEFRTTVLPEQFDANELRKICEWLKGSKKYVIQNFIARKKLVDSLLKDANGFDEKGLNEFKEIAKDYFKEVEIRNI